MRRNVPDLSAAKKLLEAPTAVNEPLVRPLLASMAFAGSGLVLGYAVVMGPGYDKPAYFITPAAASIKAQTHAAFDLSGQPPKPQLDEDGHVRP